MKVPCKGCEERTSRCHSYCKRYKIFKAKMAAVNRRKCTDDALYQAHVGQVIKNKERNTKKWGNKDEN